MGGDRNSARGRVSRVCWGFLQESFQGKTRLFLAGARPGRVATHRFQTRPRATSRFSCIGRDLRTKVWNNWGWPGGGMARVYRHWVSEPRPCVYLRDGREASLEYRLMLDVSTQELEHLLERGWRRFGPLYFRPACRDCSACVPLRVSVASFRPSRSQRRVWRRRERFRLVGGVPTVDASRLALYRRWHAVREHTRDWSDDGFDATSYEQQFAFPHPSVRELAYYDVSSEQEGTPRLVALAIMDETANALSAVYTFHDPEYEKFSLGTLSILGLVERAKQAGKKWVYLGYRILGCVSSEYKARFVPHELLWGWPAFGESAVWLPHTESRASMPSSDEGGCLA